VLGTRDAEARAQSARAGASRRRFDGRTSMHLIAFLVFGLVIGLLARAIMPGTQSMGLLGTMLLGCVGSLAGGILGNLLFSSNWERPVAAGWIGSVLGALLLLAVLGRTRRTRLL
jgi:uncharacterized membrane protein YeaQ/YmgE (transglycosylase-associated protein family)